jgi:hypothetical protein
MKATVYVYCDVFGYQNPGDTVLTSKSVTLSAQVNFPSLPRPGEGFYFGDFAGNHPLFQGKVARVEWWPEKDRKNVLVPIIWLESISWNGDDTSQTSGHIMDEIKEFVAAINTPVKTGEIQFVAELKE